MAKKVGRRLTGSGGEKERFSSPARFFDRPTDKEHGQQATLHRELKKRRSSCSIVICDVTPEFWENNKDGTS